MFSLSLSMCLFITVSQQSNLSKFSSILLPKSFFISLYLSLLLNYILCLSYSLRVKYVLLNSVHFLFSLFHLFKQVICLSIYLSLYMPVFLSSSTHIILLLFVCPFLCHFLMCVFFLSLTHILSVS